MNIANRDRESTRKAGLTPLDKGSYSTDLGYPHCGLRKWEELAEEGNAFEADAIYGVENAGDPDVRSSDYDIPKHDVPDEYLDNDEHLVQVSVTIC